MATRRTLAGLTPGETLNARVKPELLCKGETDDGMDLLVKPRVECNHVSSVCTDCYNGWLIDWILETKS